MAGINYNDVHTPSFHFSLLLLWLSAFVSFGCDFVTGEAQGIIPHHTEKADIMS